MVSEYLQKWFINLSCLTLLNITLASIITALHFNSFYDEDILFRTSCVLLIYDYVSILYYNNCDNDPRTFLLKFLVLFLSTTYSMYVFFDYVMKHGFYDFSTALSVPVMVRGYFCLIIGFFEVIYLVGTNLSKICTNLCKKNTQEPELIIQDVAYASFV